MNLHDWRRRIDEIDRKLVELLNERSRCALEIGKLKRAANLPLYQPEREKEVLEMLVAGRSNKEIGSALGIEERTVKAHVAKLMRKVGVQNRIALSVHAITHSLVTAK